MNEEMLSVVGGELVEALSGERMENIYPATGELIGTVPSAGPEGIDRAVESIKEFTRLKSVVMDYTEKPTQWPVS